MQDACNSPRSRDVLVSSAGNLGALPDNPAIADWPSKLRQRNDSDHRDKNSVEAFLDTYVPCSEPYPFLDSLDGAFSEYRPQRGGEVGSYPKLIESLRHLVQSFPERYQLTFADTHSARWRFPFDSFAKHHSKSSPDVSVSFPGEKLPETDDITWSDVSMVIEVKSTEDEDPFLAWQANATVTHIDSDTVPQVARNARNLLLTHGFLQTFAVGIYANIVRIARFDHTSAVVSLAFNLQQRPDLLQRFFWHFTHPRAEVGPGQTVVGCDPTVHALSFADQVWIRRELFEAGVANVPQKLSEVWKGRRVKIHNGRTAEDEWYLLFRLLNVDARPLFRATAVWLALRDTREYEGDMPLLPLSQPSAFRNEEAHIGRDEKAGTEKDEKKKKVKAAPKIRVLKEAWRQVVRTPESAIYERLAACIPDSVRWGLPKWVCGSDLAVCEVRLGEDTNLPGTSAHLLGEEGPRPSHIPPSPPSLPSTSTRSHIRFVVDEVGRPLTEFKDTRELVLAMRDAIIGHRQAWELAGVLHRDVSIGNIMIVDRPSPNGFRGFIHDFDHSAMTATSPPAGCGADSGDASVDSIQFVDFEALKERTGTFFFIALDLLINEDTLHTVCHDLESFFWVLLWVVLRHTVHCLGQERCEAIFVNGQQAVGAKLDWLGRARIDNIPRQKLVIRKNKPLTTLMMKLRALVRDNYNEVAELTYEKMLKAFDDALAMNGWPAHDPALPVPKEAVALELGLEPPKLPALVVVRSAPLPTWSSDNIDNLVGRVAEPVPQEDQAGFGVPAAVEQVQVKVAAKKRKKRPLIARAPDGHGARAFACGPSRAHEPQPEPPKRRKKGP